MMITVIFEASVYECADAPTIAIPIHGVWVAEAVFKAAVQLAGLVADPGNWEVKSFAKFDDDGKIIGGEERSTGDGP